MTSDEARQSVIRQMMAMQVGQWKSVYIQSRVARGQTLRTVNTAVKRVGKDVFQVGATRPFRTAEYVAECLLKVQEGRGGEEDFVCEDN